MNHIWINYFVRYRQFFPQPSQNAKQCISQETLGRTGSYFLLLSVEARVYFSHEKMPFLKNQHSFTFFSNRNKAKGLQKRAGILLNSNNFIFLQVKNSKTQNGRQFRQIYWYSHKCLVIAFFLKIFILYSSHFHLQASYFVQGRLKEPFRNRVGF